MTTSCHATFTPYGAYALKATYQRNLTIAMSTTLGLVGLLCVLNWLMPSHGGPVIKPGRIGTEERGGRVWPTRPPEVLPDQPSISASRLARPTAPHGTIPVPVPDDDLVDNNAVVMSPGEISASVDWGDGTGGEGGDGEAVGMMTEPIDDSIPVRGEFKYCEVYPEAVYLVEPDYPRQALALGQEGVVVIEALIDREGGVREAVVAKSSGVSCLDAAALRAAYLNKYKPAIQGNQPTMVWVTYQVDFKIK